MMIAQKFDELDNPFTCTTFDVENYYYAAFDKQRILQNICNRVRRRNRSSRAQENHLLIRWKFGIVHNLQLKSPLIRILPLFFHSIFYPTLFFAISKFIQFSLLYARVCLFVYFYALDI